MTELLTTDFNSAMKLSMQPDHLLQSLHSNVRQSVSDLTSMGANTSYVNVCSPGAN